MPFLPIAEYRPDVADVNSVFTKELKNVIAAAESYIPMPTFRGVTKPLPSRPLGAFSVRNVAGESVVIVGTEKNLFMLDNTTLGWKDISKDGGYNANAEARWSFALFGHLIIAVNQNDPPQVLDTYTLSTFRDLGGNPPRAAVVKIWGDFVALMHLTDYPSRVHWSGLNDAEFWTPGQKSCDYQDFPDGGIVQGSNEATNPIIFLQSAIYLGTFIAGSDIVFSFKKIQDKRGAKSLTSIASRGAYTFYIDEGGFFQISSDGQIIPVGFEKVDRTFFEKLNGSNLSEMYGIIDPFYNRVYWAFDYQGTGTLTEMLVYDWVLQRWTYVEINASLIMNVYSSGYTLEGLDTISTHIEELPFSLDSKAWQGQAPVLGCFSRDYILGSFSGINSEAVVVSQEIMDTSGAIQRLESVNAIVDTDESLISVGGRFRRNRHEPITWTSEKSPSYNTGRTHVRARFRYLIFKIRLPLASPWTHIKGFDVETVVSGSR